MAELTPPFDFGDGYLPWVQHNNTTDSHGQNRHATLYDLICTPWHYVQVECLVHGKGLLSWEWQHYKDQLLQQHSISRHRTGDHGFDVGRLVLVSPHRKHRRVEGNAKKAVNMTSKLVSVDCSQAVHALRKHAADLVLSLDGFVHMTGSCLNDTGSFQSFEQGCAALSVDRFLSDHPEQQSAFE